VSSDSPVPIHLGGAVDRTIALYIERAEDADLLALLAQGRYANVLTSRQMGKSSLVLSTARALMARGIDCAIVDVGGQLGASESQLDAYAGLLETIRDQLALDMNIKEWLAGGPRGTPNQHFLRFFRELGSTLERPVVIFLDEIDSTLRIRYADDLFTAIRTIHNERSIHPGYARFTFCLVGVASPNDLIKNQKITAFNIGVTLELRDFDPDRDDLSQLRASLHPDRAIAQTMLDSILYWTGGHPYLTMKLAFDLAGEKETDVDAHVQRTYVTLQAALSDTHFDQVIRFMAGRLSDSLATFALYERILEGAKEPDLQAVPQRQLKLSGLVKRDGEGYLIVRNRIYATLFDQQWIDSSRPRRTVRRLRLVVAVLTIALAAIVTGTWLRARQTAREHMAVIESRRDLREATMSYEILTGRREAPVPAFFLRPYRNDANTAYAMLMLQHGRDLLVRAATERERGAVDEALLLGARAAELTGQPLDANTATLFLAARFDRLLRTLRGPPALSGGMAVSRDGRYVAIGNVIWSSADGQLRFELPEAVNAVAFDEAGRLYSGNDDGEVKQWRLPETKPEPFPPPASRRLVRSIAVSPDGTLLGTVATRASSALLRTADGTTTAQLAHADGSRIAAIRFSSAGDVLTAGDDRTARLWTWSGERVSTLTHDEPVTAAAISPDGNVIATAAGTRLMVWSARGASQRQVRESSDIEDVAVSDDGMEVAVVTSRGFQRYAAANLELLDSIPHSGLVAVAYGPKRQWAVTRTVTLARVWDLSASENNQAIDGLAGLRKRLGLTLTDDDRNVIPMTAHRPRSASNAPATR
jgi:AAA-like domain/WD domain, G-beta repeat